MFLSSLGGGGGDFTYWGEQVRRLRGLISPPFHSLAIVNVVISLVSCKLGGGDAI